MGPKKPVPIIDENSWRVAIENAPLDEETWKVKVILIEAAGSDQDRIYLNKFETYAAQEKRFVVKNICKTETVFMVNQLGSDKKVKEENLRVFEEGNSYLKDKKDIPPEIFALIIKHLILKMKEEYLFIKRQRLDVQEGMRRESATMFNKAEVRGTVTGAPPVVPAAASQPVSPVKPKDTNPIPEVPEGKKFNTSLRERGEEWRDKVYVDDYPTDGPNLYVALTGFVEPFLPGCLIRLGIPLTGVVQIRINPNAKTIPSSLNRSTQRGQSQTKLLTEQSLHFWDILQLLRIQKESADDFKNTAFVVYYPPYWPSDDLSGEPDKIYDELCYLMYDIQDLSRQHLHYLDNMDIIKIPEEENDQRYKKHYHKLIDYIPLECITIYSVLSSILNAACTDLDEESSNSLLTPDVNSATSPTDKVTTSPTDKVTTSPTDKLATSATDKLITSATDKLTTPPTDKLKTSENFITEVFNTLCKTEGDKKRYRLTYGEEYETHKNPMVINYGDFAKYNTFHLGYINLDQIVFTSLLGMPVHNLWLRHERPTSELEAKVNYHVNVLLSCFDREDVETSDLNRLIHILACRKLYNNRSSLKKRHMSTTTISNFKKVYLKRSIFAEPLPMNSSTTQIGEATSVLSMAKSTSNEAIVQNRSEIDRSESCDAQVDSETIRINFLFDCPDISELVSAAEIANNQPMKHMIDDFDYFEDFSGISALQIMCDAFNKFNCLDYNYCEVTDCCVFMFFNSHDNDGVARNEWRYHLSSPLCLQDFFDYILEEHYDWIKNEEMLYDENLISKAKSESKDVIDPSALKSCIEDTEVEKDLLMEGSLKEQAIKQLAEEASKVENENLVLPSTSSPKSLSSPGKSSKKTKSLSTTKSVRKSLEDPGIDSTGSVTVFSKPFLGYDIGDRRVEVFGKDATYFSKDGTKVSSVYSIIIPMNLEYIILNINPGNSYNEFWIHKALGEFVKPDIIDSCESFRIATKDQVMINIKKQTYKVPLILTTDSTTENIDNKNSTSRLTEKDLAMEQTEYENKTFHSLFITWPNGLITETVHENNSSAISHIKQYHVSQMPGIDEDMRCISLNGEVIIFKTGGDIEVFRPDGSIINVTKYSKRVVVHEAIDKPLEESSDKAKKAKDKVKDKSSKASNKPPKNTPSDDSKIPEEINLEYELVIDEFGIINANGLKQHYVNNTPFDIEKLLIQTATDFCVGEIFSKRMDGTTILLNTNGVLVVTFPNKTRILTKYVIDDDEIYPDWTDDEIEYLDLLDAGTEVINSRLSASQQSFSDSIGSKKLEEEGANEKERTDGYISINIVYTIEHSNFSTVTINKLSEQIYIDSPNETKVVVDKDVHYNFILDNVTTADFDGEYLNITYEACPQCRAYTNCKVKIMPTDESELNTDKNWVRIKDSFCKKIVVNDEGGILVDDTGMTDTTPSEVIQVVTDNEPTEEEKNDTQNVDGRTADGKSDSSMTSHGKCRELYLAKTIKFFVFKRDLSCSELVHRVLIDRYQSACRWQPWCSINHYDTFGDHRSMVSILTPVHLTETEKWLMNSILADKPKFLTYKDLNKVSGKGFYHWMRPYKRWEPKPIKPECVLPPRLPRAYILRTLERQWPDPDEEELRGGKELLRAVLRYRKVMEAETEVLLDEAIIDPRSEEERRVEDIIQSIAHKVYKDLKEQLLDDVERRACATITTQPKLTEEMAVEEEMYEEETSIKSKFSNDRVSSDKQIEQAEPSSSNLKRYWRRRAEELKEEEFYKYLLREGVVPPYFANILGGAIWWEMNHTAGEAVTESERRKMKCICAEESNVVRPGAGAILSGPFI